MEYNSSRPPLIISEYGRNIQKMIDHAISVEDKEERNKVAQAIIVVMGQLNPHLHDITDFTHKLWDHLYIISDFKLDVDSPYPKPARDTLEQKPEKVKYPSKDIKFLHYGKNVEMMIEKAIAYEEGPEKEALVEIIANLMKKFYLTFNRDSVGDEVILKQLTMLSKGALKADNLRLASSDVLARNVSSGIKKRKKTSKPSSHNKPKKKY